MRKNTPDVSEPAPDFTVQTSNEESFQLSKALSNGENILLVFYRGHW